MVVGDEQKKDENNIFLHVNEKTEGQGMEVMVLYNPGEKIKEK